MSLSGAYGSSQRIIRNRLSSGPTAYCASYWYESNAAAGKRAVRFLTEKLGVVARAAAVRFPTLSR